jgi:hypothetical protein
MALQVIFKYEIPIVSRFELRLPLWHRILSVQVQGRTPRLWVLFDVKQQDDLVPRKFLVAPTGTAVDLVDTPRHVGTFQMADGLVWHLFTEEP